MSLRPSRVASVSWARSGPLLAHRSDEESPGCPAMRLVSTCAVCAAPVEAESGVECGQCQTLYCGAACQGADVRHSQVCNQIAGAGGARQVYVNTETAAAADAARAACAQDLAGQTCFICREGDEAEGLVRGCACRGEAAGVAHLSCLLKYARAAHQENYHQIADENSKWVKCAMCSHLFTGKVALALAWGCLKTYLRVPSPTGQMWFEKLMFAVAGSFSNLARALSDNGRYKEALHFAKCHLDVTRGIPDALYNPRETKLANILGAQNFVGHALCKLGQTEEAIAIQREVFAGSITLDNLWHPSTLGFGYELSASLLEINHLAEAKTLLCVLFPLADRALKENDHLHYGTHLSIQTAYARVLYSDEAASIEDLTSAVTILEDVRAKWQRIYNQSSCGHYLAIARAKLALANSHVASVSEEEEQSRSRSRSPSPARAD